MAKNGQKMVEIFLGGSHMKNSNILNNFGFSIFSFWVLYTPCILTKCQEDSSTNRV